MNILKLHDPKPLRLGHKKVSNPKTKLKDKGQLNLFNKPKTPAKILSIRENLSPFETAYKKDEEESDLATEAYLKAIDNNDRPADAYCNLGIIEARKGNDVKAIDYFSRSLVLDTRHYESHFNLANIYLDNGNYPLAQLHYKTAIGIEPGDPNIYFNLGLVQALQENLIAAIDSLKKYVSMVDEEGACKAKELLIHLSLTTGL